MGVYSVTVNEILVICAKTSVKKNNIASANSLFDGSCGDPASLFADDAIWWNGLPRLPGLEGKTEHKGIETIKKILYGAGQDQPNSGADSYDLSTNRFTDLLEIADNDKVKYV